MHKWMRAFATLTTAMICVGCSDIETGPNISGVDVMSISEVRVQPSTDSIFIADTVRVTDRLQLRGVAIGRSGADLSVDRFVWHSSDVTVATVDSFGVVTPVRPGSVEISASAYRVGRATVVVLPEVRSVTLTAPATQALDGDTIQLLARAFGYDSKPITRRFLWSSGTPSVATVDSTGRVVFVSAGAVTIAVSTGGKSANILLSALAQELLSVDAGGDFGCGIATRGRSFCWGLGHLGQLGSVADSSCYGDRPTSNDQCAIAPKRMEVSGLQWSSASTGEDFGCGIVQQQLYCWGNDAAGQLGDGRTAPRSTPQLATVGNERFTILTAGSQHACTLNLTGLAYCWGKDSTGQLGDNRRINSSTPIPVVGTDGLANSALRFSAISAGVGHTCAVQVGGRVFCWGDASRGALGNATRVTSEVPLAINSAETFASVSAGGSHTCGLTTAGAVYCWGNNASGQIGVNPTGVDFLSPVFVGSGYTSISAGDNFTCAIASGRSVQCWGSNAFGQLARGEGNPSGISATPQGISSGLSFNSVSAGRRHACAVATSGGTWCWGSNIYGALGNSLQAAVRSVPERIARLR